MGRGSTSCWSALRREPRGPSPSEAVDDGQRPPAGGDDEQRCGGEPLAREVYTPSPGSVPVKDTANCFSPPATPPGPRSATDASTTDHRPAAEVEVNVEPTCGSEPRPAQQVGLLLRGLSRECRGGRHRTGGRHGGGSGDDRAASGCTHGALPSPAGEGTPRPGALVCGPSRHACTCLWPEMTICAGFRPVRARRRGAASEGPDLHDGGHRPA